MVNVTKKKTLSMILNRSTASPVFFAFSAVEIYMTIGLGCRWLPFVEIVVGV